MIAALAPHVRTLVLLTALGSLAVAAAPVVWHLGGWSGARPEAPAAPVAAATDPEPVDLGPILGLAPFGTVAEAPEPEAPIGETTLDLALMGVIVQPDPAQSTAYIARDGTTAAYAPGDAIEGGAELVEVATTHVVIEVEGELQTLSFEGQEGAVAAADAPAEALSGPDRLRALVAAQEGAAPRPAAEAEDGPPETTQDYIALWRDRIRANPAQVLDTIGLIPTENGYTIAEEHDSGVGLAGLQAGDVVRSVNGQAVGDVERDRRLFDDVAASGLARIEVQRGDRTIVMSFPLE